MSPKAVLTPELHKEQVLAYTAVRPVYDRYAKTLNRVLSQACSVSFPEAFVQSRAKAVASFAEKAARKFGRYPDAVHQLTDLCGARVIVQTTEQVAAVRLFIEANFDIIEKEDKGLLLGEQEFGYRDMHYIVRLRGDRDAVLGLSAEEHAALAGLKAEIQVRTWVQHAWADTLHDRIYKNKMKISSAVKRTGNLLAALMEEGDRNFSQLADELDGLIANYTAIATKHEIDEEVAVQELIFRNADGSKKRGLAMKLAKLLAVSGDYAGVVPLLAPYVDVGDASQAELLLDLGSALCRVRRHAPDSDEYQRGVALMTRARALCADTDVRFVPHLRKGASVGAKVFARLGEALARIPDRVAEAREHYQRAHEMEPLNPYYLSEMVGLEMSCGNRSGLPAAMRTAIKEAIKTCRAHAVAGIELPYAFFTAGRLSLFIGNAYDALGFYARAIGHCLSGVHVVPADILADERMWLGHVHYGIKVPPEYQYAIDLLGLGLTCQGGGAKVAANPTLKPPVLIVAGGAASLEPSGVERARVLLAAGLSRFVGTVVSGGTTSGVPGCVGDIAHELGSRGQKRFHLVGYVSKRLAHGVLPHPGYDATVQIGDDFLPDQLLRNWRDVLEAGIRPDEVILLGFGGGPLAAVEYRMALGFGAVVGLVGATAGTAAELLDDPMWRGVPNLLSLPADSTTIRAFLTPAKDVIEPSVLEEMAKVFHSRYVTGVSGRLPENMRPWPKLPDTYRTANVEQARYVVEILEACGFGTRKAAGEPPVYDGFTDAEVERMAEMEHGRWNVERSRDGWRPGLERDDVRKIHNCLVSWADLGEEIRNYDREAVRLFPAVLAQAGLEVFRP